MSQQLTLPGRACKGCQSHRNTCSLAPSALVMRLTLNAGLAILVTHRGVPHVKLQLRDPRPSIICPSPYWQACRVSIYRPMRPFHYIPEPLLAGLSSLHLQTDAPIPLYTRGLSSPSRLFQLQRVEPIPSTTRGLSSPFKLQCVEPIQTTVRRAHPIYSASSTPFPPECTPCTCGIKVNVIYNIYLLILWRLQILSM
jgi:hypothetical protein